MNSSNLTKFLKHWMVKLTHGMLTCAEADAFVVDYLDDHLDPAQRRRFEQHIKRCPACHSFLEAYKRTLALSRSYGEEPRTAAVPRMPEELVQAILAAKRDTLPP